MGDHVLPQQDCEDGRRFPDDIAHGGHDLDDHRPLGEGGDIFAYSVPPMYGIPYRCCYSRNVENLLLAGRLMSTTHVAHSSSRVMGTGAAVGQAVGLAAALCKRHGCSPREVYERHLQELQSELLASDGTILGRALVEDSDLAPGAHIEATSELRFNNQPPGQMVPLIAPAGVLLWDWPEDLSRAEVYVHNRSGEERLLTLTASRATREPKYRMLEDYRREGRWNDLRDTAFEDLGQWEATVPAGFEGWIPVDTQGLTPQPKDPGSDADRLLLWLSEAPQVHWAMSQADCEIAMGVEHSHQNPRWTPIGALGCMRLTPAPPVGEAANVIDGHLRRYSRGPTHMWMSDPGDGLPQELSLTWDTPVRIARVTITFDTLCRDDEHNPWRSGAHAAPQCVSDYELSALVDGAWQELLCVRDNCHRCRSHDVAPVTAGALKLRVLRTCEEGWGARVYSVRVYGESGV